MPLLPHNRSILRKPGYALLVGLAGLLVACSSLARQNESSAANSVNLPVVIASGTVVLPTATATPQATLVPAPTVTPDVPALYSYVVVNAYPHDPEAFTQGLVYHEGLLYEGTGLRGRSSLRRVELETGTVLQERALDPAYFGEGVTLFGNNLIQLTWQARIGFVYDRVTFERLREFSYPTEGWGLTHDGTRLIMSDGSATLFFLDPQTLQEVSRVTVTDRGTPVTRLNELEYIQGTVYANVWQTDRIARIDPESGQVTAWIDLAGLQNELEAQQPVDVLNGIAYDAENDRVFVTGKLWPKLFEIDLVLPE